MEIAMYEIEKGVPLQASVRPTKFPFKQMEVGDSFVVESQSARISVIQRAKVLGYFVTSRKQLDGTYRIWRVA